MPSSVPGFLFAIVEEDNIKKPGRTSRGQVYIHQNPRSNALTTKQAVRPGRAKDKTEPEEDDEHVVQPQSLNINMGKM
jgi:hypothetical protein